MCGVTGAIVAGSVVSAGASIYSSNKAAGASQQSANAATNEQARQYDQTRADYALQRELGNQATSALSRLYGYGSAGTEGAFDAQAYLAQNPDVAADPYWGANPEAHYQQFGMREGRARPSAGGGTEATAAGSPDMSGFFTSPDYQFRLTEGNKAVENSAAARSGLLSGRAVKEAERYSSDLASGEYSSYVNRLMQQAGLGQSATDATTAAGTNAANNTSQILINNGNNRASAYASSASGVNNAVQSGISNYLLYKYLG